MNELTNYLPMLLALVLALTLVTNIIVQVLKSLLYDMLPTNLLAFLVAAVVTVGAGFGLWSYYRFAITGWMIVALIALIFLVAFSAMFGYDKLVQLMEQAEWIIMPKAINLIANGKVSVVDGRVRIDENK